MSNRTLAFLYSPEIDRLSYPPECPFKAQRAGLTRQRLKSFGLLGDDTRFEVPARRASADELRQFHTRHYLDELQRAARGDLTVDGFRMGFGGPDTPVFGDMFEFGAWACGAGLTGAGLLLEHKADVVFNLLGGFHHAAAERAEGFCYLNDVVLACMALADAGKRVASVDLDAHHGDGTQGAFYDRNDVLTISMHESGKTLFPWAGFESETGKGAGAGYNLNVPLPAETYDEAFLRAFDRAVMPALKRFDPDVLVVELGMDILAGDPLTHLRLTNNVVVEIVERLTRLNRPMLITGGGGYHVENTVRGWALAWRTFCDGADDTDFVGMGGVMLASTEWAGGLRDRALAVSAEQRRAVDPLLDATIRTITDTFSRLNGPGPGVPADHSAADNRAGRFSGTCDQPQT